MAASSGGEQAQDKYSTVNDLFKDICDKLRAKTGITAPIEHKDIADIISNIRKAPDSIVIDKQFEGALKSSSDITTINSKLNEIATTIDNDGNLYSLKELFDSSKYNSSIDFDFSKFKSNIIDTSKMFYFSSLTSINLSNLNTKNVMDMNYMFWYCNDLTSLDVSKFDTSSVKDMSYMFSSCSKLTSLNVSNFKTSNVRDMSNMFNSCSGLTSLNVSNFNTSSVKDMSYMFGSCSKLTSLDISNFKTSNVRNIYYMFRMCRALESLKLGVYFKPNVEYIQMFHPYNYQNIELTMNGNTNFSYYDGNATLDLTSIWQGSDATKIARFETFANSLGTCSSDYTRTIKIYTDLYNALNDSQKALITNKGYALSYGTS